MQYTVYTFYKLVLNTSILYRIFFNTKLKSLAHYYRSRYVYDAKIL